MRHLDQDLAKEYVERYADELLSGVQQRVQSATRALKENFWFDWDLRVLVSIDLSEKMVSVRQLAPNLSPMSDWFACKSA